jgi:hypothetical protein
MKRLLLTNWHTMLDSAHNWTVFNTASDTIPTDNIRFYGCFFYSKQYLIQDALNGCEVSTFKKIK